MENLVRYYIRSVLSQIRHHLSLFGSGNGTGTTLDWDFCTSSAPCTHGHGDCDGDDECAEHHLCGEDNCRHFWTQAEALADCCVPGVVCWVVLDFFGSILFWLGRGEAGWRLWTSWGKHLCWWQASLRRWSWCGKCSCGLQVSCQIKAEKFKPNIIIIMSKNWSCQKSYNSLKGTLSF